METLNRAIEGAALFTDFMARCTATPTDERRFTVVQDRRPGENRAERRQRQRNERAAARQAAARLSKAR